MTMAVKAIIICVVGSVAGVVASVIVLKAFGLETNAATTGGICGGVGAMTAYLAASKTKSD